MSPYSPPALRILQFVDAVLGDGNSLESLNTQLVMDRAIVSAKDNNSLYMLRRESVESPSGTDVVAPSAGPGRWFRYPVASGGGSLPVSGSLFETAEGPITFGDTSTFAAGSASQTELSSSGSWTLPDSAFASIVYSGADAWYLMRVDMVLGSAGTEGEVSCSAGIDLNGDLVGKAVDEAGAMIRGSLPIAVQADQTQWLHSVRFVEVTDGDVISLVLCTSDSTARSCAAFSLSFAEVKTPS